MTTPIQVPIQPTQDAEERAVRLCAQIDFFQLQATLEKITKINLRAQKKGLAGMLNATYDEVECEEVDPITKFRRTWTEYKIEVIGTAPAYNGWEFIAKLDWDKNAGLIVRNVPGREGVDRNSVVEGWCDHCKVKRQRNVTYVVKHIDTSQTLQVGSSCIKDFTGQFTTIAFPELPEDDEGIGAWFGPRADIEYSPLTILATAWACIKLEGFKPSRGHDVPTRQDVATALYPSKSKRDREWAAQIAPLADEAHTKAEEILNWVLSDDFKGDTDYVLNLKAVAAGKAVSHRNIGIMVSAPQAYARYQERTLIRQREASVYKTSRHIGQVDQRLRLTVEIKTIRYVNSNYGSKTLYTMVTRKGNVVKWYASKDVLGEDVGAKFLIRATIKSHDDWEGMKSTKLTMCRVVEKL